LAHDLLQDLAFNIDHKAGGERAQSTVTGDDHRSRDADFHGMSPGRKKETPSGEEKPMGVIDQRMDFVYVAVPTMSSVFRRYRIPLLLLFTGPPVQPRPLAAVVWDQDASDFLTLLVQEFVYPLTHLVRQFQQSFYLQPQLWWWGEVYLEAQALQVLDGRERFHGGHQLSKNSVPP
jgi:hypothetical protein